MIFGQFTIITIFAVVCTLCVSLIPFFKKITEKYNYLIGILLSFSSIILTYNFNYCVLPAFALFLSLVAYNTKKPDNINYNSTENIFLLFFVLIGTYQIYYAENFISFYVGLEMQSISLYIIIALINIEKNRIFDAIKYFVLSASFSALTLLGIAYIYGAFGILDFKGIAMMLTNTNKQTDLLAMLGLLFILIGSFFKLAAPPFHLWVSDIYASLNYRTIAVLSIIPKIAFIILITNILYISVFSIYYELFESVILGISIFAIFLGSVGLIVQNNIKRFLAYSGIVQIGFLLISVISSQTITIFDVVIDNQSITLFYLFSYLITLLPMIIILNNTDQKCSIYSLSGLVKNNKIISHCLCFSLLSFAGIPIFIGFAAKVMIFANLIEMSNIYAIVAIIIPIIISIYGYINLVKIIYFDEPVCDVLHFTFSEKIIIYGCTIVNILAIFFVPEIISLLKLW